MSARVGLAGRHHVEDGKVTDHVGVVERHPVGAARAAVVTDHPEPIEPERRHRRDLVAGQRAHAVGRVVGCAGRLAARAVAAQVGGDDREPLSERGGHPVPHEVGLRDAVQQQDRRPVATQPAMDRGAAHGDVELLEPLEHPYHARPWV
jgi:hypothetical protein